MNNSQMTLIRFFRIIAFFEGCSFLALGFTMVLKYQYQMPLPNYFVGMAHGFLFIAYVLILGFVWVKYRWPFWMVFVAFLAAFLPFGTFYADHKWFKKSDLIQK